MKWTSTQRRAAKEEIEHSGDADVAALVVAVSGVTSRV